MRRVLRFRFVGVVFVLTGCPGAVDKDSGESGDTGETDTGDTGATDTEDTGKTDTGETDTGETDTGETDTGETDACDPAVPLRRVPEDYATIGEAISAAQPGDQVCVAPGIWMEHLDFAGRSIAVIGALGRDVTVIDGDNAGPVVIFQTAEPVGAVLQGFTLTHGYAIDEGDEANDGGGVRVYGADDLTPTLRDLTIVDNTSADDGGGIYIKYAAPVLEDLWITRNHAGDSGGGLRIVDSDPLLTRVLIEDNDAPGAGGGIAMRGGHPVFTDVVFARNHAGLNGGGLIALESAPTFTNVAFSDNVSDEDGGAARIIETGPFSWTGGELRGNTAAGVGGGLHFVTGGAPTLTNLLFAGNNAAGGTGGAQLEGACGARFTNVTFTGNVGASGGAVTFTGPCAEGGAANSLHNSIVTYNTSPDGGGVTVADGSAVTVTRTDVYGATLPFVGIPDPTGQDGNLAMDPAFVSYAPALAPGAWDLHLGATSPLRAQGDPTLRNPDGTPSDPGAYGGPAAAFGYYADTDTDGMYDGWEALHALDPAADDSAADPDADTLLNAAELTCGTDPMAPDTDGDGRSDGDEVNAGADPLDPSR